MRLHEAGVTDLLGYPTFVMPRGVEEIRFNDEQHRDDLETMVIVSPLGPGGTRLYYNEPFTITDCYSVAYVRRPLFGRPRPIRYLDRTKLEAKRRRVFEHGYPIHLAEFERWTADVRPCTCTLACIPAGITEEQYCREAGPA